MEEVGEESIIERGEDEGEAGQRIRMSVREEERKRITSRRSG